MSYLQSIGPVFDSKFSSDTVTFRWTDISAATPYSLWVGSILGGEDVFAALQTGTSATLTGLPTDGRTLYVRIWTESNGTWVFNQYTFGALGS